MPLPPVPVPGPRPAAQLRSSACCLLPAAAAVLGADRARLGLGGIAIAIAGGMARVAARVGRARHSTHKAQGRPRPAARYI
jgi:hypothetical protein